MAHVRVTLSRDMLQALLGNLLDVQSPASEYVVESEIDGEDEITRIINLASGDVFEQTVQKQKASIMIKPECKIYEFPKKYDVSDENMDESSDGKKQE